MAILLAVPASGLVSAYSQQLTIVLGSKGNNLVSVVVSFYHDLLIIFFLLDYIKHPIQQR